ncbi:CocE/NonD family hydrolase [Martelella soudanensis]|uniref:CocE/NonD family hydrolase n=1 Tax=unclassified Martelella TaxID=2629616 RepID=UPI0015DF9B10|nr:MULTISPECIES: CocE/NonD family hydrolase [unclassified Martelella]
MIIERDVEIRMDDGVCLRADVFRPDDAAKVPVIMTAGPYGKGVAYQDHYKASWDWMTNRHPSLLKGSQHNYVTWETVDPEIWVRWGYAVVRVDSRGSGRSPGYLDIVSPRETKDFYEAIEWAGVQEWSNGKVGLNGISYYAITQWNVASLQPPHLAAIIPWEGASDFYRDFARHGGILSNKFFQTWYPRQILAVQHGNPQGPMDPWLNERSTGPAEYSGTELENNRSNTLANLRAREMDDTWYRERSADWENITVPFLSAANWAGCGLHPRGNFTAFKEAASTRKWLEVHPGRHEEWFLLDYGMDLQKRFLDYHLKGIENGWNDEPPVWLHIRRPFQEEAELRKETAWPLERTRWVPFYLSANDGGLDTAQPRENAATAFVAGTGNVRFLSAPVKEETEITGPLALTLFISSSAEDADLFVTLQAFSPEMKEVTYVGSVDPAAPLSQGWLRASHRKLCPQRSTPWQPWHTHDEKQSLTPGAIVEVVVEIWPTCIVLPEGYRIAVDIRGRDFQRDDAETIYKGSGPWLHDDTSDRPAWLAEAKISIHTGYDHPSRLIVPVISAAGNNANDPQPA